ncbi:MAG: hypothetical protein LC136_10350, partial [Burkholderiales bacterium]|nr:hypothetical protein [Burkholderiales bacterium]
PVPGQLERQVFVQLPYHLRIAVHVLPFSRVAVAPRAPDDARSGDAPSSRPEDFAIQHAIRLYP